MYNAVEIDDDAVVRTTHDDKKIRIVVDVYHVVILSLEKAKEVSEKLNFIIEDFEREVESG